MITTAMVITGLRIYIATRIGIKVFKFINMKLKERKNTTEKC